MDIPVYKLWLIKPNLSAVQLPPEKQQEYLARNAQALADVGGKVLLTTDIFSHENYQSFGIESFPSLQAVIDHQRCLREMNWLQYMDAEIYLGTSWRPEAETIDLEPYRPADGVPAPIYKVYMSRNLGKWAGMMPYWQEKIAKMEPLRKELGIFTHIGGVVTLQFNEYWLNWGLERDPNHEALEKHYKAMLDADWWQHMEGRVYLGTANGGLLSGLE